MSDVPELAKIVQRLCPDWSSADVSEFDYLPGGYNNRNYRFRRGDAHFVLRVPQSERAFIDRELEYEFYRSSSPARVPEIVAFDTATGIMISRWQAGTLLCDVAVEPVRLVPYLRELHGALGPCSRSYNPISMARQQLSVGLAPQALIELAERLQWAPPERTTCHNDLNPWNVIQEEAGRWVTLDWEWLGTNDPVFDLVVLHQGLELADHLLPELAESLVGATHSMSRLHDCMIAYWLREYAWAHAEVEQGNDRAELSEQTRASSAKLSALTGLALPV